MRTLIAASVLLLALAGCAPTGGGTTDPTTDPVPSETVTPEPAPQPDALVLGVQGLTLVDGDGAPDRTVSREDVVGSVALLTELFGDPAVDGSDFGTSYDWGDVSGGDSGWFNVRFDAAEFDGVVLRTSEGIQVGSSRDDVLALTTFDPEYDGDGDGLSDDLGLEPAEEPGTDSLTHPGNVGTSYIDAQFDSDIVTFLFAPAGDWRDV